MREMESSPSLLALFHSLSSFLFSSTPARWRALHPGRRLPHGGPGVDGKQGHHHPRRGRERNSALLPIQLQGVCVDVCVCVCVCWGVERDDSPAPLLSLPVPVLLLRHASSPPPHALSYTRPPHCLPPPPPQDLDPASYAQNTGVFSNNPFFINIVGAPIYEGPSLKPGQTAMPRLGSITGNAERGEWHPPLSLYPLSLPPI